MAKKKSIRVDFAKSCITYNKLNTIDKIRLIKVPYQTCNLLVTR